MSDISIIIPVYNVQDYLNQCLNSVISQSFKNIEIICINDGSTDNSLTILNEFATKDSRIKVISQKNQGVSTARNKGLDMATGKYVMFLDSDDYLLPDAIKTAYENITSQNADIGIFGFYDLLDDELSVSFTTKKIQHTIKTEAYSKIYRLQHQMWNKIYKREFLNKYNIRVIKKLKIAEDTMFCMQCYYNNPKYVLINDLLLVYRTERVNSATTQNIKTLKEVYKTMKTFIELPIYKKQSNELKMNIAEVFSVAAYYFCYRLDLGNIDILQKSNKQILIYTYYYIYLIVKFLQINYGREFLKTIPVYSQLQKIETQIMHQLIKALNLNKIFKFIENDEYYVFKRLLFTVKLRRA